MNYEKNYTKNETFFFDSYAFIEIIKGNVGYVKYKKANVITTKLNLFEVAYFFIKDVNQDKANFFLKDQYSSAIEYNQEIILSAAKLKFQLKKRKLSMADCIGYIVAIRNGVPFLTGDKEFYDLPNVEFVK